MPDVAETGSVNKHITFRPGFRQRSGQTNRDEIVKAAYALYLTGKSVAAVAKVYRVSEKVMYERFKARGLKLRTRASQNVTIVDGLTFRPYRGGLRGTDPRTKQRIKLHRYLWEKKNGPVPAGYCIHRRDNNPMNHDLDNLELVARRDTILFCKAKRQ